MTSLLLGRFQPLHEGHIQLVEALLREGRKVVIGLRDGPRSAGNPYSSVERRELLQRAFGDRVTIIEIPDDGSLEVVRSRDVGWDLGTPSPEVQPEQMSAISLCTTSQKLQGQTLWFLGLPAAGKTTLANKVVSESVGYVLLDGDVVRQSVENFEMGHNARLLHLSYMAFCCQQLNRCGINVAAAFVTPLRQHRVRIRQILPDVKFIWLQCTAETCATRDPKGLWRRAARGELLELTGAGGEWEDPTDCALTVRTDVMSVDSAFRAICDRFGLIENGC